MITKYIKADITTTELKYIAQGVNCQNVMGAGVAKAIYEKYPDVKKQYHEFYYIAYSKQSLLGKSNAVRTDKKVIFNCFTQFDFGNAYKNKKRYVNYSAIVKCFEYLMYYIEEDEILAIPKIGCGLAGGDWDFVEQLINDTVGNILEIWVYEV